MRVSKQEKYRRIIEKVGVHGSQGMVPKDRRKSQKR